MILQLRRRLPDRHIVIVTDMGYEALELLHNCQSLSEPVIFISRLKLDAALFEPAPPKLPGQIGRPRLKGQRLPSPGQLLDRPDVSWTRLSLPWKDGPARTLEITSDTAVWYRWGRPPVHIRWVLIRDPLGQMRTEALVCTDTETAPIQIIQWYLRRWRIEVTFQEVRAHLWVETQRQWSDSAIARTTPLLLGLFSWVTLVAGLMQQGNSDLPRSCTWYAKCEPTFSDAIALVRRDLWLTSELLSTSPSATDVAKVPVHLFNRPVESLAYAV